MRRRVAPLRASSQDSVPKGDNDPLNSAKRFVRSTGRDLGKKASEVGEQINDRVEEAVKEADRKFSISTKVRHAYTDVKRKAPYWKKQFSDFSATPLGKITLWGALFVSISSGFLFKALNIIFILWWTLPLLALPFAGRIRKAQEKKAAQAARDAEAARDPFSAFKQQFQGAARGGGGGGAGRSRASPNRWQDSDDGPVIEAEYTTIDDDSQPKRRR